MICLHITYVKNFHRQCVHLEAENECVHIFPHIFQDYIITKLDNVHLSPNLHIHYVQIYKHVQIRPTKINK